MEKRQGFEYPPLGLAATPADSAITFDFPLLHFGHGRIEVGDAMWEGLPALFFGKNGQGIGVVRDRHEPASDKETLVLMTFANLAGLEALEAAIGRVKEKLLAAAAPAAT